MQFRRLNLALGLGLASVLGLVLLRAVDVQEIISTLGRADLRLVPLAVAVHIAAMWLRSLVWRRLLPSRPPTRTLFQVSIIGFAINYLMPVRIGELVRVYLVKKWCRDDLGAVVASLIAERVLDGLIVSAILLVSILFVPAPGYVFAFGLTIGAAFTGIAVLMMLARWRSSLLIQIAEWIGRRLPTAMQARFVNLVRGFAASIGQFGEWRALPSLLALTVAGWVAQFAVFYLTMYALPLRPSVPEALLDGSMANFATLLPSAPGAVGAFDAVLISLLVSIQGAALETAVGYALLVHAVVALPIVVLGGFFVWRNSLSLPQLFAGSRAPAPKARRQESLPARGAAIAAAD